MTKHAVGESILALYRAETAVLQKRNTTLTRRVARLTAVLREVEWRGHRGYCPLCDGWEAEKGRGSTPGKHAADCELAKLLAQEQP